MISPSPIILGEFQLEAPEYMYIQYMPVKFDDDNWYIPSNLKWALPLLSQAMTHYKDHVSSPEGQFVYLTAKHMWVDAGGYPNRAGWHIDGYLTDDVSYVWCDSSPTEFCVQEFDLSLNHTDSLREMSEQVREENIKTFPVNTLLMLDNTMVHRVACVKESGYRTFVKINVSKEKYALKGNAKNPLVKYDWEMIDRSLTRNCPQTKGNNEH